jgi:hypothetical protein
MFFLANKLWRPFFYENRTITEAKGAQKKELMTIAEMVTDFMEHVFVQLPSLKRDVRKGWKAYIKNLYDQSPAIREHLKVNGSWYSIKFLKLLGAHIKAERWYAD